MHTYVIPSIDYLMEVLRRQVLINHQKGLPENQNIPLVENWFCLLGSETTSSLISRYKQRAAKFVRVIEILTFFFF